MFSSFLLLLAAGVGFRLALSFVLKRRFGLSLAIPQVLALALIFLSAVPSWLFPVSLPLPLGFVLGVVLPDLLFRRA